VEFLVMQKKNVEALATPDDCELAESIAKADPTVQAMLRERNITNLDLVACDPWSGTPPPPPPLPNPGRTTIPVASSHSPNQV